MLETTIMISLEQALLKESNNKELFGEFPLPKNKLKKKIYFFLFLLKLPYAEITIPLVFFFEIAISIAFAKNSEDPKKIIIKNKKK